MATQLSDIEHPVLKTLTAAKLSWHKHVIQLDLQQKPKVHTRVLKSGTERAVVTRPRVISPGACNLGSKLLRLARTATERAKSSPLLFDQLVTDTGLQVAPIEVNARDLARMCRVCERTTRTYITELTKVSFVVGKKFHGTNARYELWINPEYVWEKAQNPVEKHARADSGVQPLGYFLPLNDKKLPLSEVLETLETPKDNFVRVDKLPPHEAADASTGNPSTRNGSVSRTARDAGQASKERHQGRGAARTAQNTSDDEVAAHAARVALRKAYVESAFTYQNDLIYNGKYDGRPFTEQENRLTKIALWRGVYDKLETLPEAQWDAFHKQVLRRIELVRDNLALRPKWIPLPYAQITPGRGYFDAANERGFAGTYDWWLKDQERQRQWQVNAALLTAETEMLQRYKLDRGQKVKLLKRSHVHIKTLLQLHTYHRRILHALGGENAIHRFESKLRILKIVA